MKKSAFRISLTWQILIGLVLGTILGHYLHDPEWNLKMAESDHANSTALAIFSFMGFTVFMNLLKMLIAPLIATSVIVAVTSVGDVTRLGKMGTVTLLYYFSTMAIAVVIGLICVTSINPGAGLNPDISSLEAADFQPVIDKASGGLMGVLNNLVSLMIPENIIHAFAFGQTLGVIVFSIFFAIVLTMLGEKAKPVLDLVRALYVVFMRMVEIVLLLAPIGVFSLLAWTIARVGLGVFASSTGVYMLTVLFGLAIHAFVVLPAILWIFTRENAFVLITKVRYALMTALGTDSSSATLPVTIECTTKYAGVSERSAGLVLPLGATINMDGTALYEAVAVVFMAQAFGVDLTMTQLVLIAVTATFAAVGAAGIPSAGLVTMVIVLDVTNQSLAQMGDGTQFIPTAGIALIIGVDRLLDMARTTVNVWGDVVGAKIVSKYFD